METIESTGRSRKILGRRYVECALFRNPTSAHHRDPTQRPKKAVSSEDGIDENKCVQNDEHQLDCIELIEKDKDIHRI